MGQDVTPRAPQRRKAPAAGARPNFPVPGQNPEGGFLRPRAGHSVPKARPLPPAEPSVSPHSPTRQAAGRSQGEAEGGGRTGGKRPAAPPQSPEEGERRGKHCSSRREKGERRSGERKRLPPRPPMVRPGSGARRRASRMERAEAEGAVRARGRPKGGGESAPGSGPAAACRPGERAGRPREGNGGRRRRKATSRPRPRGPSGPGLPSPPAPAAQEHSRIIVLARSIFSGHRPHRRLPTAHPPQPAPG